jgi:hypothetical protein
MMGILTEEATPASELTDAVVLSLSQVDMTPDQNQQHTDRDTLRKRTAEL